MMNPNAKTLLLLAAALTTVSAFTGCGKETSQTAPQETVQKNTVSETADSKEEKGLFKSFQTVDLEGNTVDSSVFSENKVTLVNTWSTGCSPCVQELPFLGQLNRDYAEKGGAVKGLYYTAGQELSDDEREDIEELTSKAGADYQQLLISPEMMETETLRQLQAFPTTYLVDSEGNILDTLIGAKTLEDWQKIMDRALEMAGVHE